MSLAAFKNNFGISSRHEVDDEHRDVQLLHTPTVFDKLLTLNVVDLNGHRHVVKALSGKNLATALVEAGFPETYFFPNMGFYTQHLDDAHVFIPKEFWRQMPCFEDGSDEADAIKRMFKTIVQDYAKDTSFFASYITLTPEMNGMNLGFGPIKPWIIHPDRSFGGVHDSPTSKFTHRTNEIFG